MYREQVRVLDDNKWSTIMHNTTLKKKTVSRRKEKGNQNLSKYWHDILKGIFN